MRRLKIGQTATTKRLFTIDDVNAYRQLTGDENLGFAERSRGSLEFVPGPLLGGLVSEVLGTKLPGYGTNWLKQDYQFFRTAYVGIEITARVEITMLRPEKLLVYLEEIITDSEGNTLCQGKSLVLVRDPERF